MALKIYSVLDPEFKEYGRVVDGYDYSSLLKTLVETTPQPADHTIYVPSDEKLEADPVFGDLRDNCYGGMPIQIGYCNGSNTRLNCLEYHRDSEIDIPAGNDAILLLAKQTEIINGMLDTAKVKAFRCPAGVAVEVYATTLHYAPCNGAKDQGFRVIIVLPKDTNTEMPEFTIKNIEDGWMTARNKWLLAHPESSEAAAGAHIGLEGENIDIASIL